MSEERRPLGWNGALVPARARLDGAHMALAPLEPGRHATPLFEALHAASADPAQWRYMGYGPFADLAGFESWLWQQATVLDPVFYAIVPTGAAPAGLASFMRLDPRHGVIEIGHLSFAPRLQRTTAATEAIFVMLADAFDRLGYRRVEWKCDAENDRSRRAAERFGFTFEGVFRQATVVRDRNRDTAWFAMLDHEWPARRAAFEAWLAPANVDPAGRRLRPLGAFR